MIKLIAILKFESLFELDEDNPDVDNDTPFSNWYDIEDVADDSNTADEDLSDDVIGDDSGTYYYHKITDTTRIDKIIPTLNF